MYYVNHSGQELDFIFQSSRYQIHPWEHVSLPDEMVDLVDKSLPLLQVDEARYVAEFDRDFRNWIWARRGPSQEFYELMAQANRPMDPL